MQDIIVIGGGASGMTAAIAAARRGAAVTILEQNDIMGKKILSTGNGRCNLTNLDMKSAYYRGGSEEFVSQVLSGFTVADAFDFFSSIGIYTRSRNTYVYPLCDQASAVREAFAMELRRLGIRLVTGCHVNAIRQNGQGFLIECEKGKPAYKAARVILAAGSRASRISGSDGSGYQLARGLGHSISPVVPALVPLCAKETYFRRLKGIRVQAQAAVFIDGKECGKDTGELQLTDYGISGIPVFQISRYAAKALREKREVKVIIDFLPQLTRQDFLEELFSRQNRFGQAAAGELLCTIFPSGLIPVLLAEAGIREDCPAGKLTKDSLRSFASVCKAFPVTITGTKSFEQAQICAGGVRTGEINPKTLESRKTKGLYITGEVLDVDGICGGYNLHFAWATGMLAGKAAAEKCRQHHIRGNKEKL